MYKNIILSGGSTKGFSYIGVLKSLEDVYYNRRMQKVKENLDGL